MNHELARIVRAARQRAFGCTEHQTANCSICRVSAERRAADRRAVQAIMDSWEGLR